MGIIFPYPICFLFINRWHGLVMRQATYPNFNFAIRLSLPMPNIKSILIGSQFYFILIIKMIDFVFEKGAGFYDNDLVGHWTNKVGKHCFEPLMAPEQTINCHLIAPILLSPPPLFVHQFKASVHTTIRNLHIGVAYLYLVLPVKAGTMDML